MDGGLFTSYASRPPCDVANLRDERLDLRLRGRPVFGSLAPKLDGPVGEALFADPDKRGVVSSQGFRVS